MNNFKEQAEQIKEKVGPKSLFISRIPEKTKTRFKELANEEFESDYGMLLKKLIEIYDGYYPTGHEEIEAKIDLLSDTISDIKEQLTIKVEEKPKRKSVSGKVIGGKENE